MGHVLRRLPDWPARLAQVVERSRHRPGRLGQHDCTLFALDCIDAQTGSAIAERYRGRYRDMDGAALLFGPGWLANAPEFAAREGLLALAPEFAGRGCVVLGQTPEGPALGVVTGRIIARSGRRGLVFEPRSFIVQAWGFA